MKKNITMRLSAVLLVAVLLTTCVISGTWAKYTTSSTGSDSATVAKWGVQVSVKGDETAVLDTKNGETEVEIISNTGALLAPGTKGQLANVAISGKPDVAVAVKYVATVELGDNWVVGEEYYCPIIVYVDGVAVAAGATAEAYEANIKAAIEKCNTTYEAGLSLTAENVVITWAWAFGDGTNDAKDTALGNAENLPTITIGLTVTVEQID